MVPKPELRGPNSDDVCSVCVPKFQKRDGAMETPHKGCERGVDRLRGCEGCPIVEKSSHLFGRTSLFVPIYVSI
jgi:hypothetical protein